MTQLTMRMPPAQVIRFETAGLSATSAGMTAGANCIARFSGSIDCDRAAKLNKASRTWA
jgi:hypothetical protein